MAESYLIFTLGIENLETVAAELARGRQSVNQRRQNGLRGFQFHPSDFAFGMQSVDACFDDVFKIGRRDIFRNWQEFGAKFGEPLIEHREIGASLAVGVYMSLATENALVDLCQALFQRVFVALR